MAGVRTDERWTAAAVTALRTRLGLCQEDFAARVGVRSTTVNRWEKGRYHPQRMAVAKLDALVTELDSNGGERHG